MEQRTIDLVIISDAKFNWIRKMTQEAILTAVTEEKNVKVNPIVIERTNHEYALAKTYKQEGEFGYNKFLNYGASLGNSEFIAFANNDLIFTENWASKIIANMGICQVNSACAYCPKSHVLHKTGIKQDSGIHYGYEIRYEFCGWFFVWRRDLWDRLKLDERIHFWASDNATAEQLKMANEKHILVTNAIVHHLHSRTLGVLDDKDKEKYMHSEVKKFNRLYGKNYFGLGKDQLDKTVRLIIPIFGDYEKWGKLAARASQSALKQTAEKEVEVAICSGTTLQDARNKEALNCNREWLIFLDADDTLDENYVEEMIKHSDGADVLVPSVYRYYDDENRIDRDQYWFTPRDLMTGNYIVVGAMVRTEMFKRVGGFRELPALEDYDLWLRMEEIGARFKQVPSAIYQVHVSKEGRNSKQQLAYEQVLSEAKKRRNI